MKIYRKGLVLLPVSLMAILLGACGWINDEEEAPAPQATTGAMQAARQAFWQRDMQQAEQQYLRLAEGEGSNADAWGELGNVYYLQGKWKQAASAYTEAAIRLIDDKQVPQAMYLHRLVMQMDGQQAMRIDEKLRAGHTAQATE